MDDKQSIQMHMVLWISIVIIGVRSQNNEDRRIAHQSEVTALDTGKQINLPVACGTVTVADASLDMLYKLDFTFLICCRPKVPQMGI